MTVTQQRLMELPIAALHEQLSAPIRAGDAERLGLLLDELADAAHEAIEADVAQIALQRDRLDRVARRLADDDADHRLAERALGDLHRLDGELDRARTRLLAEMAEERRDEEAGVLRSRIVFALGSPRRARRPRELAEELRVDPSQVSRELRQLLADGAIERVDHPSGASGDRRAHWYALRRPRRHVI